MSASATDTTICTSGTLAAAAEVIFMLKLRTLFAPAIEASCLVVLSAEHLDDAMTADRFLQGMVEVAHRRLLGPAHGAQPVREMHA